MLGIIIFLSCLTLLHMSKLCVKHAYLYLHFILLDCDQTIYTVGKIGLII